MIRLIIGVIGMIITYHYRPPSGIGDAFGMLLNGRDFYLKEPVFLALMSVFGLLTFFGMVAVIKSNRRQ